MNPIVNHIKQTLSGYYPDSEITAMARWLLTRSFGMTAVELYTGKDNCFSPNEQQRLEGILDRLKRHEPLQYIIGIEEFCGLTLEVNPSTLIPRPETAELVDWIVRDQTRHAPRVLDIGTGSGCIAIALARHLPGAQVTAWDISDEALRTARRNGERHATDIRWEHHDALHDALHDTQYDLIVSNPPYITESEKADMEPNVLEWEPRQALFVPDADPLLFYRRIGELGRQLLAPGGTLYFEINRSYGPQTVGMLGRQGYTDIRLRKDLAGEDRMVRAVNPVAARS